MICIYQIFWIASDCINPVGMKHPIYLRYASVNDKNVSVLVGNWEIVGDKKKLSIYRHTSSAPHQQKYIDSAPKESRVKVKML